MNLSFNTELQHDFRHSLFKMFSHLISQFYLIFLKSLKGLSLYIITFTSMFIHYNDGLAIKDIYA